MVSGVDFYALSHNFTAKTGNLDSHAVLSSFSCKSKNSWNLTEGKAKKKKGEKNWNGWMGGMGGRAEVDRVNLVDFCTGLTVDILAQRQNGMQPNTIHCCWVFSPLLLHLFRTLYGSGKKVRFEEWKGQRANKHSAFDYLTIGHPTCFHL